MLFRDTGQHNKPDIHAYYGEHEASIGLDGELQEGIKVRDAKLLRGSMLLVTFSTGEKRLFDATKLKGGAFAPLADEKTLGDFTIFHGVVTWLNGEIDLAPETMYCDSYPYSEEVA